MEPTGAPPGAVQVLLVGSFHMDNPRADLVNLEVDDVLAPARQQQIAAVVAGLQRFRPTKVAVERPIVDTAPVNQAYADHAAGRRSLGVSEAEQLGFRLAQACGHLEVFPIDVMDDFYVEEIERLLDDPQHAPRWRSAHDAAERGADQVAQVLAHGTIGAALRALNTQETRAEDLALYLRDLLPIASEANWSGPDMVANWYRRNFRIAANLHAISRPGDRVVVIYGAGHAPVLEHALRGSGAFVMVDPLDYLDE